MTCVVANRVLKVHLCETDEEVDLVSRYVIIQNHSPAQIVFLVGFWSFLTLKHPEYITFVVVQGVQNQISV